MNIPSPGSPRESSLEAQLPPLLRVLLGRIDEGVLLLDSARRVVHRNAGAARFLGPRLPPERDALELSELLSPADPVLFQRNLEVHAGLFQCMLNTSSGAQETLVERVPIDDIPGASTLLILRPVTSVVARVSPWSLIAFYSVMIHEVKNPLAAIKVLVQGMELELAAQGRTPPTSPGRDSSLSESLPVVFGGYLSRINREIDRIVKLLDSVKYLSRLHRDAPERYDAVRVARSVMALSGPLLERRGIRLAGGVLEEGAWLFGEPDELRQVLLNLVEHAATALPTPPPTLRLGTRLEAQHVVISLEDPAGLIPLEPIHQVLLRPEPWQGGGLGLAVVRFVLERHQGRLAVVRPLSGGVVIQVWLPAAEASPAVAGAPTEPVKEES